MQKLLLSTPKAPAVASDEASSTAIQTPTVVWNVPNRLSAARILMAVVVFAAFEFQSYTLALAVFLLAVATDWLDGYWARRFNQITQLGRILDPFADKMLVCGTFVYLAATPESGVAPWMAVLVLSREVLVTALRSFLESQGGDFSATMSGKWKMVLQCVALGLAMYRLQDPAAAPAWLTASVTVAVWAAMALTLYSGFVYVRSAISMIADSSK